MRLCLFEDSKAPFLEPVALTRPAFALRCGAGTILERQWRALGAREIGAIVRPYLADLCRGQQPQIACNDAAWRAQGNVVYANARWFPALSAAISDQPGIGLIGDEIAYVAGAPTPCPDESSEAVDAWLAACRKRLPAVVAKGVLFTYLWDIVRHNGAALGEDETWFAAQPRTDSAAIAVMGPRERLIVSAEATIEPYVSADTRLGPVLIGRGAVVQSFTRLEGPCSIGPDCWVLGAKVRAETTIGPCCRVGGEVEASVFQGHANKYHDGFLGHSYLGEWVNLAAGTQTSDLRNDYGMVRTTVAGARVNTRQTKVGAFFGDHARTGLGALLNTGSVVGVFANVLPNGSLLPQIIPSFCQTHYGQIQERWDMQALLATAATAMRRRGRELTDAEREVFFHLYDELADSRRRSMRDAEVRRLRKSV